MNTVGKVLLGVFGAAVVVILIAVPTAIFLNDDGGGEDQRFFSLEDVFNSTLRPRSYSMKWISDYEYLHLSLDGVQLVDAGTQKHTLFIDNELLVEYDAFDYILSADRQYVAFVSNYKKQWRHSFFATYSIYDLGKKALASTLQQVQLFSWSPEGHKLAYVLNNDVYIKTSPELASQRVTDTGKANEIYNGVPDWVYEEEMFSSAQGMWWSPGGRFVAYAHFNDSQVPHIDYTWFGDAQYPSTVSIPYPKAGATNPTVKLFVVEAENVTNINEVVVPPEYGASEHYLATVTWATDERIAVQWLKRVQNDLILQIYSFSGISWVHSEHLKISSSTGWVGRFSPDAPVFSVDTGSYFLIMSDASRYKHLHQITGGVAKPITSGKWEVISISLVTEDSVYFVSNEFDGKPFGRNIYRINLIGDNKRECLTCDSKKECMDNSAYFSSNASFYTLTCNGPGIPHDSLISKDGPRLSLEDNKEFANDISSIQMPKVVRGTIKIDGYDLWYDMTLPPDFSESKKYPLLINVYAGPCSQQVTYRYSVSWDTYLASTEKIIVATFDGRGSGYQGDEIMHKLYRRLGTYEVEDQINAARQFGNWKYVDKERMAIWGWSYGGYVSSMALGSGSGVFKCGMAVAPVSGWKYYDSIYTERYMNPPSLNQEAYDNSTVMTRAKNFHKVQYLLVHGTADDNVHFQQGAEIAEALVDEQVDFDAMWYTDKDHSLWGSANQHVYTHMSHFLLRCFA